MGIRRFILEMCVATMRSVSHFRDLKTPLSIFVLRNNDLGDLVVITPLFQALRTAFPDAYIVAGVSSWTKDILKKNPHLSEVIECDAPWHNHRAGPKSLAKSLRYIFMSPEVARLKAFRFDVGIDVVGSPFGSMLLIRLQIPIRLGRKGYAGGHTGSTAYLVNTNTAPVAQGAIEFARLLKSDAKVDLDPKPQLFLDSSEIEEAEQVWLAIEEGASQRKPRVVMAPGAGTSDKQWPVARFAELAGRLSKDSSGCVLGSAEDFALGETIADGLLSWDNRCGRVSLRQSMALISLADLVICHSSFVMHVASAFNKPAVVILTRVLDPESHAFFWEVKGVHYSLSPHGDQEHVSVDAVEQQARLLLNTFPLSELTNV